MIAADDPLPIISSLESARRFMADCAALRSSGAEFTDQRKSLEVRCYLILRGDGRIDDGFYESREWRSLRYRVLRGRGRRCECCGNTPSDGRAVHVDHIVPRSKNPALALTESNLQILCADCNLGKSNTDSINWSEA